MSLVGAVVDFSDFSTLAALSVEEGFRTGGLGRGDAVVDAGSCLGVAVPIEAGCEFILLSDLMASLVENIRVRRFVIDGFSTVGGDSAFCGSEGGAALPLALRFSVLGTERPFWPAEGRVSGEPMADDVCEGTGEGWTFSTTRESRCAETVAMMLVGTMVGSVGSADF